MVTGRDNDSFINIYDSANKDAVPLLDVAAGETQIVRLGPRRSVGLDTWLQVQYDGRTGWIGSRDLTCRLSSNEAKSHIGTRAKETMLALKSHDMNLFAKFVHVERGVRFSPYAYVEPEQDLVFSSEQVAKLLEGSGEKRWGYYDGSGDPIDLDFDQYYREFVFDRDYSATPRVSYNDNQGVGNTADNSFEVYPGAIVVEFTATGPDPNDQLANVQHSLRLVFEQHDEGWYVVGIIHDEWTI